MKVHWLKGIFVIVRFFFFLRVVFVVGFCFVCFFNVDFARGYANCFFCSLQRKWRLEITCACFQLHFVCFWSGRGSGGVCCWFNKFIGVFIDVFCLLHFLLI